MKSMICITTLALVMTSGFVYAQENSTVPKEVRDGMRYFVGSWKFTAKAGDKTAEGTMTVRWARGRYCVFGNAVAEQGDAEASFSYVIGWDASTGWLTERGVTAKGGAYTVAWTKKSNQRFEGIEEGTQDGKPITATYVLEKQGDDRYTVTGVQTVDGEDTAWELKFTRVPAAKKSRKGKKR